VRTQIETATLRDLSYIAANLRPDDRRELEAQMPGASPVDIAIIHLPAMSFIVELDGNPEMAFGAVEQRTGLWCAWSWGTRSASRCMPAFVRFFHDHVRPAVLRAGAHRVEARALADNVDGQRTLIRLGATRRCILPGYGVHGQEYILYDWTRGDSIDVLQQPRTTQASATANAA
jgi:hypothetical protein